MKRRATGFAALTGLSLALAACAASPPPPQPGQRWEKLDHVPPAEVLEALPGGVTPADIVQRLDAGRPGPCYYYVQYGQRHPVVTADMAAAGYTDAPFCVEKTG